MPILTNLQDVLASIGIKAVDDLSCDSITVQTLQVIALLSQIELTKTKQEEKLSGEFMTTTDKTKSFKEQFADEVSALYEEEFGEESFVGWLGAQFKQSFLNGMDNPLGPEQGTQLVNSDQFSPFTTDRLRDNTFGQDRGAREDWSQSPCESSSGTGLASTFTSNLGSLLRLTNTAGEVAGFAAHLYNNPADLVSGLVSAANTMLELLNDSNTFLDNIVANARLIRDKILDLSDEDYGEKEELVGFSRLLSQAVDATTDAEQAVRNNGEVDADLADTAIDKVDDASDWACTLRPTLLFDFTLDIVGLIQLMEQQVAIYDLSNTQFFGLNTNFQTGFDSLEVNARLDPIGLDPPIEI